jgi:hypothetical protein
MSQKLDKNKIRDSIQKARPQDLLYLAVNPTDKNSLKTVLIQIEKFCGKDDVSVILLKN